MMVHVSLRRTHHELAKRQCQRLRIDMNHHAHPSAGHRSVSHSGDMNVLVVSMPARPSQAVRRGGSPVAGLAPPSRAEGETGASTRTASREASRESPAHRRSWAREPDVVRRAVGLEGIDTDRT